MAKKYSKRGQEYPPVTEAAILEAVKDWQCAEDVGELLWPHLHGHGPPTGGPSSCAVAATFQLRKLEHAGKVRSDNGRPAKFKAISERWQTNRR